MKSICGLDCCVDCPQMGKACKGCVESGGRPCGGECIAANVINKSGFDEFLRFKRTIIDEINALGIDGLSIDDLNLLNGSYVNLEYPVAGGKTVKLLDDNKVYLGNQIERPGKERCYGVVADEMYLLICEYGCNGADPEIILYKKR